MEKSVFIISGEESGDVHGASLIRALRALMPGIRVGGVGGPRMRGAGQDGLDSRELSVVGIFEVIGKLSVILRAFAEVKRRLRTERPECVVLIDFPDFNLRVARTAKKLGIPVVYYISPQVWAWRRGRVAKIARLVDRLLVVFPFEVDIYREAGVDVEYVGHPLVDIATCPLSRAEARAELGLGGDDVVISLLPGSRTGEVTRILGPMLGAAALVERRFASEGRTVRFIIPAAESIDDALLEGLIGGAAPDVRVVRGRMYTALRASDAAAVASGTATLETAIIGTPMVLVYRMTAASYRIGRALIGVKHVGLPNIVAGRTVVPELIQDDATPERIASELMRLLTDTEARESMTRDFSGIREALGDGGAAARAAAAVARVLDAGAGGAGQDKQ